MPRKSRPVISFQNEWFDSHRVMLAICEDGTMFTNAVATGGVNTKAIVVVKLTKLLISIKFDSKHAGMGWIGRRDMYF